MNKTGFTKEGARQDQEPRDASTIILLRDPREVLLVKRHGGSNFMAGAHVFPGGKVDRADRDLEIAAGDRAHFDRLDAAMSIRPDRPRNADFSRGHVRAAIRELEEETSITIAPSALECWAHWITPSAEPRRFDTQFFVGRADRAQEARINPEETIEALWIDPEAAIARHEAGDIFLPPPTLVTLLELAPFAGVEAILAYARSRRLSPILPKITAVGSDLGIVLPWDALYAESEGESLPHPGPPLPISRIVFDGARWRTA